jgi:rRNA maturation RNase YbeY
MDFPIFPDFEEHPTSPFTFVSEAVTFEMEDEEVIFRWLADVASVEGFVPRQLAYIFCSDEYLLSINRAYLNHDYYTDIITFPYGSEKMLAGDLFISIERVRENAVELGVEFREELSRVMLHGLLHLTGYGDTTDAEALEMRARENFHLANLKAGMGWN